MKLLALLAACAAVTASAQVERDERLDIQLTPAQAAICAEGGGCVVMTVETMRGMVRKACRSGKET